MQDEGRKVISVRLVWARSLNMARLLAAVASALRRCLAWAISGEVADFAAVVALLTLNAVTREMTVATAGVARLLRVATTVAAAEASTTAEVAASVAALGAVTRDVSDLAALVALLVRSSATAETTRASTAAIRTLAAHVSSLATGVA